MWRSVDGFRGDSSVPTCVVEGLLTMSPSDARDPRAAAFLLWACFLYLSRRAQALRERRFGASVRDKVARHLAQLDYQATRAVRLANVLRGRMNGEAVAQVVTLRVEFAR